MHDRFVFRINLNYVHDAHNKKRMHNNYIDNRAGLLNLTVKTKIDLSELIALQEAVKKIRVSKDIVNKFIRLINDLDRQAILISDRRQNECFKIMQGSAALRGSDSVSVDDFMSLVYVLWEKEEHIPIIEGAISKIVNPYDDRFKEYKESFKQIRDDIDSITDSSLKSKRSIESKGAIEKIVGKMNKLISDAVKCGKDVSDFNHFRDEMIQYNHNLINSALGTNFGNLNTTNDIYDDSDEEG